METRRNERKYKKEFTAYQVSAMDLQKYNNLLTSGRLSNKDPKDYQILYLVGVAQNLSDHFNKSSDKSNTSNRESTKG